MRARVASLGPGQGHSKSSSLDREAAGRLLSGIPGPGVMAGWQAPGHGTGRAGPPGTEATSNSGVCGSWALTGLCRATSDLALARCKEWPVRQSHLRCSQAQGLPGTTSKARPAASTLHGALGSPAGKPGGVRVLGPGGQGRP